MDEEFETNLGDNSESEQDNTTPEITPGESNNESNDSPDNATNSDNTSSDSGDEPIDEPSEEPEPEPEPTEEELEIEEFKKYARIDYNDDDNLIRVLLEAAKNYIKRATGKTYDATNKLHVLLKNLLVLHWYENRQAVVALSPNEVPFTIKNLLTFLQMTTEDESEEDTSNESETTTEEGE